MSTSKQFAGELTIPFRLGFYLVRPDVHLSQWPAMRYRGIDRLLFTPQFVLGRELSPQEQRSETHWDSYMQAMESGDLHSKLEVAMDFVRSFREIGVPCELVYAEIVDCPNNWQRLRNGGSLKANLLRALDIRTPVHKRLQQ